MYSLKYDQFDYFLEHATSETDILIGTINFLLVFIVLPTVLPAVPFIL